jgi:hypothetical protein
MSAILSTFNLTRRSKRAMSIFLTITVMIIVWNVHPSGLVPRELIQEKISQYAQFWPDGVPTSQDITLNLSYLQNQVRTAQFSYTRRTIRTKFYEGERLDLTRVNETLFGPTYVLDKTNLSSIKVNSLEELTLHVPLSPNVDQTSMSFGMATDMSRLKEALPQVMHWLQNTSVQLHVLTPPPNDYLDFQQQLRDIGLNITITTNEMSFPKRYFSVLKTLYEYKTPNSKWLVYIDDDTFLPSLPYLISHFQKQHDHTEKKMIAAISNNINQVKNFGLIPFGGGGIFISVPLAEELLRPETFSRCLNTSLNQGDQIVNDCLNNYSKIRPTWDLGLNQMDMNGDVSGYFESGRRMLTMHHWKTWFSVDVPGISNISTACGHECIFQRWQFDDNVVLSNGYSIQKYLQGISGEAGMKSEEGIDLDAVERTWGGNNDQWKHHMGPLREPLKKGLKIQYLMKETILDESEKGMRQVYVNFAGEEGGIDSVVELIWLV